MKIRQDVDADGNAIFQVDFYAGEKRIRRTLRGLKSMAEARELARIMQGDATRKKALGEDTPTEAEKRVTIGMLLAVDAKRGGISDATRSLERGHHKHLVRILGSLAGGAIKAADVDRFADRRTREGASARSINLALQILRAALNRAKTAGRISKVPCKIARIPETPPAQRALTPEELERLLEACTATPGLHDVVCILANTGLRRGELYRLTWRDVDLEGRTIRVENHKAGKGAARVGFVPLNDSALACFERLASARPDRRPDDLVLG